MTLRHFVSVPLRDEPGALGEMAHLLADAGLNIEGFSLEAGHVNFWVGEPRRSQALLRRAGHESTIVEALEIRLHNEPGQLAALAQMLGEEGIQIVSTFGVTHGEEGTLYIRCDEAERALPIVAAFEGAPDGASPSRIPA